MFIVQAAHRGQRQDEDTLAAHSCSRMAAGVLECHCRIREPVGCFQFAVYFPRQQGAELQGSRWQRACRLFSVRRVLSAAARRGAPRITLANARRCFSCLRLGNSGNVVVVSQHRAEVLRRSSRRVIRSISSSRSRRLLLANSSSRSRRPAIQVRR